jgi:hypothetical protein
MKKTSKLNKHKVHFLFFCFFESQKKDLIRKRAKTKHKEHKGQAQKDRTKKPQSQ